MSKVLTNNSYLLEKVGLRNMYLPKKKILKVLDLYAGDQVIWNAIKLLRPEIEFKILSIDIEQKDFIYLQGDNSKFLESIDLDTFDVIDIDAYGIPYEQMKYILTQNLKNKIIFITYIQSLYGNLPTGMLNELGYSNEMLEKNHAVFCKHGFKKLVNWLSLYNIKGFNYIEKQKKFYVSIKTN